MNEFQELSNLEPGEHLCWIYESEEEHRSLLTPYLRQGLEHGEKIIYIVDNHSEKEILGYLRDDGVSVKPYITSGQLSIRAARDVYLPDGAFHPEEMIRLLGEETQLALDEGYPVLRTSIEMTWALRGFSGSERLIEYESMLNQFFLSSRCRGLCQYDRRRFSPELLLDVLKTHSKVAIGRHIFENSYYIPPAVFASERASEAMLNHCIQNLRDGKESEKSRRESEGKYREILETSQEGIWVIDDSLSIDYLNQRMADMLGYSMNEIRGHSTFEFMDAKGREIAQRHLEMQKKGVSGQLEFEFVRKDGSPLQTVLSAVPSLDKYGNFLGSLGFFADITFRKWAEEALSGSEEKYRLIVENAQEGIWMVDADRHTIFTNKRMADILGYEPDEMTGRPATDFMDEETDKVSLANAEERRAGITGQQGMYFIRKDGSRVSTMVNSSGLFNAEGEYIGSLALIADITEWQRAEDALRESEEKYRRIVDHAQEGTWVSSADRTTLFVNSRMAEMLGYEVDEMIDRQMSEFVAAEDREAIKSYWERRRQGLDEQFELRMAKKDGSIIHTSLSAAAVLDEHGEFSGSVSMIADITDRKKAEEELRETRDYLDSLIQYANAPIIVWDPEMRITRFNDAFEFLTGYSKQEVIGRELDMLFPADSKEEASQKIALALAGEYWESVEIPILRKDGEVRMALWNSSNIYGKDGGLVATIAQGQDITERKRQEKELIESRERWRQSFNVIEDAMFVVDKDCCVQEYNEAFRKLVGEKGDLTGRKCHDLIHGSEEPPNSCICVEAIRTKRSSQGEIYEPNLDKYLAVSLAPLFDDQGEMQLGIHLIRDITEGKKAEEAIRESEEKYRLIVDNALEGIWTIDTEGLTAYVNPRMAEMLGYSQEELIGRSTFEIVTKEDMELQKYQFERRRLGITEQFDLAWTRKDGSRLYTTVHASPITDEAGNLVRVVRFVSDITERKEAEEALRESEEKYRLIVDNAQEGIWTVDPEAKVIFANERMAEMLGYDLAEIIGHPAFEFMDERGREIASRSLDRRKRGINDSYELEFVRKDGSGVYASVNASPLLDEAGNFMGSLGFFTDITARREAEEALRESEEKYRLIVDNAREGIWTIDEDRVTTFINRRMAEMLGRSSDEIIGRPASDLLGEEDSEVAKRNLERRRAGIGEEHEFQFVRSDGSRLYTRINFSPIFDEEGNFRGTSSFITDVTARKEAEDALAREVEVNKAIADLSGTLLSRASIKTISAMVLEIARRLTESSLGYVGYINAETGNFLYASLDMTISKDGNINFQEMDKIPILAMEKRHGFFSNSASGDRRSFKGPLHGASLERFVWVPSLMGETQVGQISLANSTRDYDQKDVELLQRLADIYAVALLRMWSEEELEVYRHDLEELVKERTLDLDRINQQLEAEVIERKSKEKAVQETASQLRALSVRLQSVREEERRSIALDVHDKLGQALTGLKIGVSLLKKRVAGDSVLEERLEGMSQLIDDTIKTVREISAQLRPGMLEDFGLLAALEWQLEKFKEATGLECVLTSDIDEEGLDKELSTALFRIAQEAMTNVARHADASCLELRLHEDHGSISMEVLDDGRGIDEEQVSAPGSLGILGMKERALAFGGEVEMRGEQGKGTVLIARIPCSQVTMDTDEDGREVKDQ